MTHPSPARARVCPHCDGFPVVAITTGARHRDDSRATVTVACPACRGTGLAPAPARITVGGRV